MENPFAGRGSSFWRKAAEPTEDHGGDEPFGRVVWNPGVLSRNGVRYLRCRSWRSGTRGTDMLSLKRIKLELAEEPIEGICSDIARVVGECFGVGFFSSVVPVACGHSRRPNCLSAVLASRLAPRFGAEMIRAFKDRFVSGVSHPKEFHKLPPLEIVAMPPGPCLVVDDVATSGFHIHEAVSALRSAGVPAVGLAWIAGVKQG